MEKRRKVIGWFAIFLLVAMIRPLRAQAGAEVTAVIPVKQEFTTKGTEEKPGDTFRYLLTSTDETSPMPQGSEGNSYEFSLKGNESTKISIPSSHGGVYRYELKQKIKKEKTGYTYDETVYEIIVRLGSPGEGADAEIIAIEKQDREGDETEGEKKGEIVFHNSYKAKKPVKNTNQTDPPPSTGKTVISVKTGDTQSIKGWLAAMAVAVGMIGLVAAAGRKKI